MPGVWMCLNMTWEGSSTNVRIPLSASCSLNAVHAHPHVPGLKGGNSTIPVNAPSLPLYTCRVIDVDEKTGAQKTWYPRGDSIMPDLPGNGTQVRPETLVQLSWSHWGETRMFVWPHLL